MLAITVYSDGYTPRGRPTVNMELLSINQSGILFPYAPS